MVALNFNLTNITDEIELIRESRTIMDELKKYDLSDITIDEWKGIDISNLSKTPILADILAKRGEDELMDASKIEAIKKDT